MKTIKDKLKIIWASWTEFVGLVGDISLTLLRISASLEFMLDLYKEELKARDIHLLQPTDPAHDEVLISYQVKSQAQIEREEAWANQYPV